jgi:hypothetical protein
MADSPRARCCSGTPPSTRWRTATATTAWVSRGPWSHPLPPPSARAQPQLLPYTSLSTCRWRWAHNASTAHGYPGADYGRFVTPKAHLWLLQDSHDPNDGGWDHTRFADINIPPHTVAELHAFVPSCDDNDAAGHCHTESDYPNAIDPSQGWAVAANDTYLEENGLVRTHWYAYWNILLENISVNALYVPRRFGVRSA